MIRFSLLAAASLAAVSIAQAQPGPPKNLQVLPADIDPGQLMMMMRGAAQGLGVQCNFCHIPNEFDKDDKPEKLVARSMIKMVMNMRANAEEFLPNGRDAKISCWTCHRG